MRTFSGPQSRLRNLLYIYLLANVRMGIWIVEGNLDRYAKCQLSCVAQRRFCAIRCINCHKKLG